MADDQRELKILLTLRNKVTKGLKKVKGQLRGIKTGAVNTNVATQKLGFSLKNIAVTAGLVLVTRQMFRMGKAALKTATDFEQHNVAFAVMLGSADKAKVLLEDIKEFAAKTPFELPGVVSSSKQLLAFGIAGEDIISTMTTLGNIAAGVGKPVSQLTNVFGQVKAAGRLMGQDLLQFTSAGIPIIAQLAEHFGVAETAIKKMVERGQVGFLDVKQALEDMAGEGGKFANLMILQSKTLGGIFSNISDNIVQLGLAIGEAALPIVKLFAQDILQALDKVRKMIQDNQKEIQKFFLNVFAGIKIFLSLLIQLGKFLNTYLIQPWLIVLNLPIVKLLLAIAAAWWLWATALSIIAAVNPITWIVLGVIALGVALGLVIKHWSKIAIFFKKTFAIMLKLFKKTFGKINDFIVEAFTNPMKTIEKVWNSLVDFIWEILTDIVMFHYEMQQKLINAFWNPIKTIKKLWNSLKTFVGKGISLTVDVVTGTVEEIKKTAKRRIEEGEVIVKTAAKKKGKTTEELEAEAKVKAAGEAELARIEKIAEDAASAFIRAFVASLPKSAEEFKKFWQTLKEGSLDFKDYWEKFATSIWDAFLINALKPIEEGVAALGITMQNVLNETLGQLLSPITTFVGQGLKIFASFLGDVLKIFIQFFKKLVLQHLGFQVFFNTFVAYLNTAWIALSESMIGQWIITVGLFIWGLITMIGGLLLAAAIAIGSFALWAAAAAASAVAGIPIIGPILAPIAYGATYALVIGGLPTLAGMALSLAKGTTEVPGSGNEDTVNAKLTPGEMVVPKSMAQGIREGNVTLGGPTEEADVATVNVYLDGATFVGTFTDDMIATLGTQLGDAIKNRMIAPLPTGA